MAPLQQPFGHELASQTHVPEVVSHSWPDAHPVHVAPAVPHELFPSPEYGSHVLPLQQPFGHEEELHVQTPVPLQVWPVAQAAQLTPPLPHSVSFSLVSATHDPPLQQPEHEPPPQVQDPLEHESPLPHGLHAAPPVPHCEPDWSA